MARVEPRSILTLRRKQSTFSTRPQIFRAFIIVICNLKELKKNQIPFPSTIIDAIQSVPGLGSSVD